MWGIIPAAGAGSGIQPLAYSKELSPVGHGALNDAEGPRAVSEYLVERMIRGGADKLCFIITPQQTDMVEYYGTRSWGAEIAYVTQREPGGLCDAVFRATPFIHETEPVTIGLPDTVWEPKHGLAQLPNGELSFLLFPVERPELFEAVEIDANGCVERIHVKEANVRTHWIWGAIKMPGFIFHALHELWQMRECRDESIGTLVNAWLEDGGRARGVCAGTSFMDMGTLPGYRNAVANQVRVQSDRRGERFSANQVAAESR